MELLENYLTHLNEEGLAKFNAIFKVLQYKDKKFLFMNRYDINEITLIKWLGQIALFEDFQWKGFMDGHDVEVSLASNLFGKNKASDLLEFIKSAKVIDSGHCVYEAIKLDLRKIIVHDIQGSKIFSKNDRIVFTNIIFTKALIPIIGLLFFPQKYDVKLIRG